jgi:hypothetical protein
MNKILYTTGDSFVKFRNSNSSWPSILSQKLDSVDYNNGLAGSSNDRSYRCVIRDICKVETQNKLDNISCKVEDLFVIVGWTSPYRFEWFNDNDFRQTKNDNKIYFKRMGNPTYDYTTDPKVYVPMTEDVFSLIKFFNQIITLGDFLKSKKVNYLFYNCHFPFGENTEDFFQSMIKKYKNFELDVLWEKVPNTYKMYKQLDIITLENLDETFHPTEFGNKVWAEYLEKQIRSLYE